jgi:hypothetical protein
MAGSFNLPDLDVSVFRIVTVLRFLGDVRRGGTRLMSPTKWDDPEEDPLSLMAFESEESTGVQRFAANELPPLFAQCWSMTAYSDPLWRAYSRIRRAADGSIANPADEGLQIQSTPRKLIDALMAHAPERNRCFVGAVRYVAENIFQDLANDVATNGLESFEDPKKRAMVALHKRAAFEHEAEVRLIYVGRTDQTPSDALDVEWDANQLIDRVVLDGRLNEAEVQERTTAIRAAGYDGPVERSGVYQRKLVQVFLQSRPILGQQDLWSLPEGQDKFS